MSPCLQHLAYKASTLLILFFQSIKFCFILCLQRGMSHVLRGCPSLTVVLGTLLKTLL